MLGKLARWLRVIGQDVIYGAHLSGYGLIRSARREGRIVLTRDRVMVRRNPPNYLLVESDLFREQLKQVVAVFGIDPFKDAFTRCVECNSLLQPLPRESVREKVPPYVFETQERFSLCQGCQRIYWPATHQERMLAELKAMGWGGR